MQVTCQASLALRTMRFNNWLAYELGISRAFGSLHRPLKELQILPGTSPEVCNPDRWLDNGRCIEQVEALWSGRRYTHGLSQENCNPSVQK